MTKICATFASDETGKVVCLFAGSKKNIVEAEKVLRDDEAIKKAGLTGEVTVMVVRNPIHFRRRTVKLDAPKPKPEKKK